MNTIKNYLNWRGDLTFDQDPLNEVDNAIFSLLAYLDFSVVSGSAKIKDLVNMYSRYMDKTKSSYYHSKFIKGIEDILEKMSTTNRFKDVWVSDYCDMLDEKNQTQFSAMCFILGHTGIFVAFRGTDNSFVGFKEDFNMSYSQHVQGQLEAVKYLDYLMDKYNGSDVYVGGHSKGGNFAVYSVCGLKEDKRDRVIRIFNNDGPGFSKAFVETKAYKDTSVKVKKIIPKDSIVGILMDNEEETKRVNALGSTGFIQHDAQNWEVMGNEFVEEECGEQAQFLDDTIRCWLSTLNDMEKALFVNEMYNIILMTTDAKKLSDISESKLRLTMNFIRNMKGLDPEKREIMYGVVYRLFESASRVKREKDLHKKLKKAKQKEPSLKSKSEKNSL